MGDEEQQETAKPVSEELKIADRGRISFVVPAVCVVIASALGIGLGLLIDWFPTGASTQADQVDTFYDVLIAVSVPVFVIVTSIVLFSVYHFKMRPGEENMDGPPIHGNTRLEIVWTTIPAVMMLVLCVYAAIELHNAEKAPAVGTASELNVRVVGEQFAWTFFYKNPSDPSKEIASNQLYVPKDESVKFDVQTKDVLHDFWVPAFRWKIDAVPGITTTYRVTPNRLGSYPVVCAELCGLGHAVMRNTAHVVNKPAFTAWLNKQAQGTSATTTSGPTGGSGSGGNTQTAAVDGKKVFTSTEANCGSCHTLADAGTTGNIGPNLDQGLKGKDAAYIKQSIEDPGADIVSGYQNIMPPNFKDTLSPEEIDALVKYLQESTKG